MKEVSTTRARLLVCEDDPDVAHLLRLMLDQEGILCDIAYNAKEATEFLAEREYSAMTLDLVLPDKDGLTLLRELRSKEKTKNLPVIVVSARAEEGKRDLNGDAFGIIDWLSKPLDSVRLNGAISLALNPEFDRRPRILHVEDDHEIAAMIDILLQDLADVTGVQTLAEAENQLETNDFDLVILDIELPDGLGVELLPQLHNKTGAAVPVLVFCAGEISPEISQEVAATLIKSKTSNEKLIETIKKLIPNQIDGNT